LSEFSAFFLFLLKRSISISFNPKTQELSHPSPPAGGEGTGMGLLQKGFTSSRGETFHATLKGFNFKKVETIPFFNLTPGPSPNWRGVTNVLGSVVLILYQILCF